MSQWRINNKGKSYEEVIEELHNRIAVLENTIKLLAPDSKYPALVEAYKEYRIIERLTIGNEQT
jgi:hypothetical protein